MNLLDAEDYRQIVLEIILSGKHVSEAVAKLRLLLFFRAANYYYSHNQTQCLEPFPSCFFASVTNTRMYDDLKTHICNIPQLDTIKVKIKFQLQFCFETRYVHRNQLHCLN